MAHATLHIRVLRFLFLGYAAASFACGCVLRCCKHFSIALIKKAIRQKGFCSTYWENIRLWRLVGTLEFSQCEMQTTPQTAKVEIHTADFLTGSCLINFWNCGLWKWDFLHSEAKLACYVFFFKFRGFDQTPLDPPQLTWLIFSLELFRLNQGADSHFF